MHQHESAIDIHMSPPSLTSLPLLSPSHPSRLSQSTRLRSLRHAANSHWLSVLHVVMYIFLCYYLNSSHPLLSPLCTQVCSLCLHLHLSLFSQSVVSHSLRPYELQHNRLPCPSPYPGVCSNSCPLSQWCHPIISTSVIPFSSHLSSFPASGSFPMSQIFAKGGQNTGASASASVLPLNIQGSFPLGLTGWISLQSKGLSRVFSNTAVQWHQFFGAQLSL